MGLRRRPIRSGFTIGVDLGDRASHLCVLNRAGEVTHEQEVATTKVALGRFFRPLAKVRVAMESGTHSPWISRLIASFGHELIVANPRKVWSISCNPRKSDRNDAEQLARLARTDPTLLGPITHRPEEQQRRLELILARHQLVRSRTGLIAHVRCVLKSAGRRFQRCPTRLFSERVRKMLPDDQRAALSPLLDVIATISEKIHGLDVEVERIAATSFPIVASLAAIAGVGTLTALAYVLVLSDAKRFSRSRNAAAYLGLTPRRRQSGSVDPELRISKAGNRRVRRLLVGSAHYVLGPKGPDCDLKRFGLRIAARGGKIAKRRAVVAVARKLAVLLHRLWVTGEPYDPNYSRRDRTNARPIRETANVLARRTPACAVAVAERD